MANSTNKKLTHYGATPHHSLSREVYLREERAKRKIKLGSLLPIDTKGSFPSASPKKMTTPSKLTPTITYHPLAKEVSKETTEKLDALPPKKVHPLTTHEKQPKQIEMEKDKDNSSHNTQTTLSSFKEKSRKRGLYLYRTQ